MFLSMSDIVIVGVAHACKPHPGTWEQKFGEPCISTPLNFEFGGLAFGVFVFVFFVFF